LEVVPTKKKEQGIFHLTTNSWENTTTAFSSILSVLNLSVSATFFFSIKQGYLTENYEQQAAI
jgi:hypothetical protein